MYDIRPAYSAKSVKNYLAYDEPEIAISFGGKGFEKLGIDPADMTLQKFNRLIDNLHPDTGENLAPRTRAEKPQKRGMEKEPGGRICGYYITFSPPKDVTLLAEFSPQADKVKEALREAADFTMRNFIEPLSTVRDRMGGSRDRKTGSLLWTQLHHTLDRPDKGRIMPQHHIHIFATNHTFDEQRGRFFSTKLRGGWWESAKIKRKFHARLRENLHRIGFVTHGLGMCWRVEGVDRELVDKFSLRGKSTLANIAAGVSRKYASLKDREPKMKLDEADVAALKSQWWGMLTERDKRCLGTLVENRKFGKRLQPARRHFEWVRNLKPRFAPDPTKEIDYAITR